MRHMLCALAAAKKGEDKKTKNRHANRLATYDKKNCEVDLGLAHVGEDK
jgi:uncharacterized protein HemY